MLFTTQIFIFVFFPLCLAAYYIICGLSRLGGCKKIVDRLRLKDLVIVAFSLGFYMWASFDNVFRLVFDMLVVYMLALWIDAARRSGGFLTVNYDSDIAADKPTRKIYLSMLVLAAAVLLVAFCLVYYNYSDFLINCWNKLFGDNIAPKSLAAPLGISFITFSAISYLTDIYRGNARPGGVLDCFLFLSFFPKIISGPIVLWKDFAPQIKTRRLTLDRTVEGVNRIMIGFAKKVILADSFGKCLASIELQGIDQITASGTALAGIIFSGARSTARAISLSAF